MVSDMPDLETVIAAVPIGITPEGWKVLKNDKSTALKLIDECLDGCDNSILEVNLKETNRAVFLPYLYSCKKELNRIKGILLND